MTRLGFYFFNIIWYNKNMDKVILHCDLNNFYASVEIATNKELGGKPIIVCGDPENRHGIVLAKNQLAKNCGIKTGDTVYEAKEKCPSVVPVPPHFEKYVYYSRKVFEIYNNYTDKIEYFGIDECWLDVTGSIKLFGSGKEIADKIRQEVKDKYNLTISVGVSFTKPFAKLGSDLKKPDATTVIDRSNFKEVAWNLPCGDLIMVGRRTEKKLNEMGIITIGDLARANRDIMREKFGIVGVNLVNTALGIDNEQVRYAGESVPPKSVSNGTTTKSDMTNKEDAIRVIYALSDLVAYRLRKLNMNCSGVGLFYKYNDFTGEQKNCKLPFTTDSATEIGKIASSILVNSVNFNYKPLRAITVSCYGLKQNDEGSQVTFDTPRLEKNKKIDETLDKIKSKYGYDSIVRGVLVGNDLNKSLHADDDFKPFQR